MKKQIIIIVLLLVSKLSYAQELKIEYQEVVKTFVKYIKTDNIDKLQTLVAYPFSREYPLPDVMDQQQFAKRYNEIFDDDLKKIITLSVIAKDWSAVGWRGIMLNNGDLWLDYDGRIIAVNYQSNIEKNQRKKLILLDKNSINEGIRDFEEPILIMETKKFRIRIDKFSDDKYRYTSWSINSKMITKPDLVLKDGAWIPEGSGGNHRYEFINGNYKYVCYIGVLGGEGDDNTLSSNLIVYKNDKEILNEPAQIIRK